MKQPIVGVVWLSIMTETKELPQALGVPFPFQQDAAARHTTPATTEVSSMTLSQDSIQVLMPNLGFSVNDAEASVIEILNDDSSVYNSAVATPPVDMERTIIPERNPKAALKEYYDTCDPRVTLTKTRFVTIMDNMGGDHMPVFTSIFVCPILGEIFLSGYLLNNELEVTERHQMVWYKTKANSRCAAAGRALDCFHYRIGSVEEPFCRDPPYLTTVHRITVKYLREHYRAEIEEVQKLQRIVCGSPRPSEGCCSAVCWRISYWCRVTGGVSDPDDRK
jgi:hypothetical protein